MLPVVWRAHYVTAAFETVPREVVSRLEDKGFEFLLLGTSENAWADSLARLSRALGKTNGG